MHNELTRTTEPRTGIMQESACSTANMVPLLARRATNAPLSIVECPPDSESVE